MGLWQVYDPAKKEFYRPYPPAGTNPPSLGQLCRTPIFFKDDPWLLGMTERADPGTHGAITGSLQRPGGGLFRAKGRLPVHNLRLEDHEELFALKAKRRPAILIGPIGHGGGLRIIESQKGKLPGYLVVPLYSVLSEAKPTGLPRMQLAEARLLKSPADFPCPSLPGQHEHSSIARLDRLSIVYQYNGWIDWLDHGLADGPLKVLMGMARRLLGSQAEHEFEGVRDLIKDCEISAT